MTYLSIPVILSLTGRGNKQIKIKRGMRGENKMMNVETRKINKTEVVDKVIRVVHLVLLVTLLFVSYHALINGTFELIFNIVNKDLVTVSRTNGDLLYRLVGVGVGMAEFPKLYALKVVIKGVLGYFLVDTLKMMLED